MRKRSGAVPYVKHHKDGTVWAKGQIIKGVAAGYWEWFRKDGTKMRSGYFEDGEQVGEWTTYDRKGRVYEECISYQLPALRLDGKILVYFGVSAKRCAFYPGSGTAVAAHKDDLKEYSTSKGTIRFQPAKPLPASLVRKLVRFRIAENTAQ